MFRTVNSGQAHIAIIDDEEAVRRALARLLVSMGYSVEQFPGGIDFLTSLERQRPDCLVLDLHMPGVDGFAVLDAIAGLTPRLPVVVITGHDTPETHQRVMKAGGSAYLRKPIDGPLLISTMAEAMGNRRPPVKGSGNSA